jgi:thioredoxin reductase (NADPH)
VSVADYDIVVAGAGPAGLTAALFAARQGRNTCVLDPLGAGGSILNTGLVEDFPGFPEGVPGFDLGPRIQEQVADAGGSFEVGAIVDLKPRGGEWLAVTDSRQISAHAVIIATGSRARKLGIAREDEFAGKGVSHCATCDGPFFRDKLVAVVGGGDSALLETIELERLGVRSVVVNTAESFSGQETYMRRVSESALVEVRHRTAVEEILGNVHLDGIRVRDLATEASTVVDVSGVFVQVGRIPNTEFLADVTGLDEHGCIPTDIWMATPLPGLFAAGDVRSNSAAQAITAAGDGATAAIAAHRYLAGSAGPSVA